MSRSLLSGLVLAVVAVGVVLLGAALGLALDHVALLGAALGGVLALAPSDVPWGRLAGFAAGLAVAWVGFALRAAWLPDTSGGRAAAVFLVVAVVAVGCAATNGVVPLWSGLLGCAALVGAYEQTYVAAPSKFLSESPTAVTSILVPLALAYLAVSVLQPEPSAPARRRPARAERTDGLQALVAGEGR